MSSSKRKSKKPKPPRRRNLKKARPRTLAVSLNREKDAVKRLPVGPLLAPATSDDKEIPALVKARDKLGPVNTEPPGTLTDKKDTDEQRTPNMAVTDGGVFDFGFATQMQLFAKMLQSPLTLLLHQQAVMTQELLNWRYPKGQPK
jgi:hypothetical protein